MSTDIIIEILEDGTASIKTTAVADIHHLAADQLLDELEDMLGGGRVTVQNPENPGEAFWKNRKVLRGGKIVKTGN